MTTTLGVVNPLAAVSAANGVLVSGLPIWPSAAKPSDVVHRYTWRCGTSFVRSPTTVAISRIALDSSAVSIESNGNLAMINWRSVPANVSPD